MTVSTPSRPKAWVRELSDEESKLGRALAGGHVPSIAKAIVHNSALKQAVFLELLDQLDRECSVLCRTRDASFFCKVPLSMLEEFCWDKFVEELQHKSPLLLQVMSSITSRNDHRNKSKSGKVHFPGICMAAAILLKERNQRMTGVQSLISLVLFSSHVEKYVSLSNWLYWIVNNVHAIYTPCMCLGGAP